MRRLVTILGFIVALAVFRMYTDMAWFPAVFFAAIAGLIVGVLLTREGHTAACRIARNLTRGWS